MRRPYAKVACANSCLRPAEGGSPAAGLLHGGSGACFPAPAGWRMPRNGAWAIWSMRSAIGNLTRVPDLREGAWSREGIQIRARGRPGTRKRGEMNAEPIRLRAFGVGSWALRTFSARPAASAAACAADSGCVLAAPRTRRSRPYARATLARMSMSQAAARNALSLDGSRSFRRSGTLRLRLASARFGSRDVPADCTGPPRRVPGSRADMETGQARPVWLNTSVLLVKELWDSGSLAAWSAPPSWGGRLRQDGLSRKMSSNASLPSPPSSFTSAASMGDTLYSDAISFGILAGQAPPGTAPASFSQRASPLPS